MLIIKKDVADVHSCRYLLILEVETLLFKKSFGTNENFMVFVQFAKKSRFAEL